MTTLLQSLQEEPVTQAILPRPGQASLTATPPPAVIDPPDTVRDHHLRNTSRISRGHIKGIILLGVVTPWLWMLSGKLDSRWFRYGIRAYAVLTGIEAYEEMTR